MKKGMMSWSTTSVRGGRHYRMPIQEEKMWVVAGRNKEGKDLSSSDNRTCLDVFGMLLIQQRFGHVIMCHLKLPLSHFHLYCISLLSESHLDLVNLGQAYPESWLIYVTFLPMQLVFVTTCIYCILVCTIHIPCPCCPHPHYDIRFCHTRHIIHMHPLFITLSSVSCTAASKTNVMLGPFQFHRQCLHCTILVLCWQKLYVSKDLLTTYI